MKISTDVHLFLLVASLAIVQFRPTVGVTVERDAQAKGIDFSIKVCTAPGNCVKEQAGVVTSYIYTGCSDPKACTYV